MKHFQPVEARVSAGKMNLGMMTQNDKIKLSNTVENQIKKSEKQTDADKIRVKEKSDRATTEQGFFFSNLI